MFNRINSFKESFNTIYCYLIKDHAKFLFSLWIRLEFVHSLHYAQRDSCAFKNLYRGFDSLKKSSTLKWLSKSNKSFHFEIQSAVKNQVLYISYILECISDLRMNQSDITTDVLNQDSHPIITLR